MFKKIKMKMADGKEMEMAFLSNAATPIRMKQIFNRDLFATLGSMDKVDNATAVENLDVFSELAYTMHCQSEKADMSRISFDTYVEWLETLDGMAVLDNMDEILKLYISSDSRGSKAKNPADPQPVK